MAYQRLVIYAFTAVLLFSVTLFLLPATIHFPAVCVTLTAGAPHCSRGSFYADPDVLVVRSPLPT